MRIVFFGTPKYAEHILRYLIEQKADIVGVVTRPDKPKGRSRKMQPPPVKELALQSLPDVPIFQPTKASTPEFAETLKALNADLFVVVAYGEIIKQFLLDIPPAGCINVHFSLLPRWRGAAPMQHALLAGDHEAGVCIIEMVLAMDAGDILGEEKISVPPEMTCGELAKELCMMSGPLLEKVILGIKNKTIQPKKQDPSGVTMAPKISTADAKIDWKKGAQEIHNQVRALNPAPGAWCEVILGGQTKRLKILRTEAHSEMVNQYLKDGWYEPCGSGSIELLEIQLGGQAQNDNKRIYCRRASNKNCKIAAFTITLFFCIIFVYG